jgi:hypothetical protein
MSLQNCGIPNFKKFGARLVAKHKKYYKGEGGGFPQVQAVVNLMIPCLLMAHSCTKNAPTTH